MAQVRWTSLGLVLEPPDEWTPLYLLDRLGAEAGARGVSRAPVINGVVLDSRNHGPKTELYCSHRYFAVTGRYWGQSPNRVVLLDSPALDALAALIPPGRGFKARDFIDKTGRDTSRSAAASRKGAELRRRGCTFEEMCAALAGDPDPAIRDWCKQKGEAGNRRELRRIWERGVATGGDAVGLADFYGYMPQHTCIYAPTREPWPEKSVNRRLGPVQIGVEADGEPVRIPASAWLDRHQPVQQMTWAPGEPMVIADRLISDGGWIARRNVHVFNLYRPPALPDVLRSR